PSCLKTRSCEARHECAASRRSHIIIVGATPGAGALSLLLRPSNFFAALLETSALASLQTMDRANRHVSFAWHASVRFAIVAFTVPAALPVLDREQGRVARGCQRQKDDHDQRLLVVTWPHEPQEGKESASEQREGSP